MFSFVAACDIALIGGETMTYFSYQKVHIIFFIIPCRKRSPVTIHLNLENKVNVLAYVNICKCKILTGYTFLKEKGDGV